MTQVEMHPGLRRVDEARARALSKNNDQTDETAMMSAEVRGLMLNLMEDLKGSKKSGVRLEEKENGEVLLVHWNDPFYSPKASKSVGVVLGDGKPLVVFMTEIGYVSEDVQFWKDEFEGKLLEERLQIATTRACPYMYGIAGN